MATAGPERPVAARPAPDVGRMSIDYRAVQFQQVRPVWLEADFKSGSCVRNAVELFLQAGGQTDVFIRLIVERHKLGVHGVGPANYKAALWRWGARECPLGTDRSIDGAVRIAQLESTGLPILLESQGHLSCVVSGPSGPVLLDLFDSRPKKIKRVWCYVGPNYR